MSDLITHRLNALSRRQWLKAFGLGSAGLMANMLLPGRSARASDYKALVCVFLYGGNDGLNTIVPTDNTRYQQYARVRKALALPQSGLVGLGGSTYGLHPSLAALAPVWDAGHLAPVFNVGPLAAPLTKAQYRAAANDSALIPDSLFSHSDQQLLWETASADALTRTGWGGRAAEVLGTVNPVISVGGNGHFGLSSLQSPLVLPGPGENFGAIELADEPWRAEFKPLRERAEALRAIYGQRQSSELGDTYASMQRDAFDVSARLAAMVETQPGSTTASAAIDAGFAPLISRGEITTPLGQQLYQIAKLVAGNATVGGNRQIFFAQLGGFDTHGNQLDEHAALLKQLGDALACLHDATVNLGMADAVTTFTQSDFGRTFAPNSSAGTDHAWGNQHLVMGGGVVGGATYGSYPTLELGGGDDVGVDDWELQGRWIPSTAVSQYAATMLGWFGAADAQLDQILPGLTQFPQRRLGFV